MFGPPRGPHATLPLAAGLGALVVLVVSLVVSKLVLDVLVNAEWPTFVYVIIVVLLGYGPSLWWWRYASSRWGTGSALDDAGVRPRWADIGWGPVVWVAALGVQGILNSVVIGLDLPFSSNTEQVGELATDRRYAVAIVVAAVVAAPIVEEIVFRGLLMRSLLSKWPVAVVILVQGVLFGVAHIDPVRGVGNIGLAMVLSGVGVVFGAAAYILRRVGPTVVAHAILNGVVMALLLSGVADRLQEDSPFGRDDAASIEAAPHAADVAGS